jgi:hypothetical protein
MSEVFGTDLADRRHKTKVELPPLSATMRLLGRWNWWAPAPLTRWCAPRARGLDGLERAGAPHLPIFSVPPVRRERPDRKTNVPWLTASAGHRLPRVKVTWSLVAVLVCAGCFGLGVEVLDAQERARVAGWVQWVGGSRLQVMTGRGTVAVDLRDVDQGAYQALRTGELIVVDGVVASDRDRVIARNIWRDVDNLGFQEP